MENLRLREISTIGEGADGLHNDVGPGSREGVLMGFADDPQRLGRIASHEGWDDMHHHKSGGAVAGGAVEGVRPVVTLGMVFLGLNLENRHRLLDQAVGLGEELPVGSVEPRIPQRRRQVRAPDEVTKFSFGDRLDAGACLVQTISEQCSPATLSVT